MMRLEWILNPGVQYGMLGAGLGLCLYLFFTLKCIIDCILYFAPDIHLP